MLNKEVALTIAYAIRKQCSNFSLTDWCDNWGVAVEDFNEFLECALKYVDLQD